MSGASDGGPVPETLQQKTGPLYDAVRELEAHGAETGWDQPERIFALVATADLARSEPGLAQTLGIDESTPGYTPVEQDPLPVGQSLEQVLARILWPAEVAGVAVIAERLVLPPGADVDLPQDPAAAQEFAAGHPDRQEVRIVAAALRNGDAACALRLRSHDADDLVLSGPDLVPDLVAQLHATLDLEETTPDE